MVIGRLGWDADATTLGDGHAADRESRPVDFAGITDRDDRTQSHGFLENGVQEREAGYGFHRDVGRVVVCRVPDLLLQASHDSGGFSA